MVILRFTSRICFAPASLAARLRRARAGSSAGSGKRVCRPDFTHHARTFVAVVALCGIFAAGAREAAAYPQFQFSSGTSRCNQCHFAPAGGGLINGWGRDEAGDTLSRGGNGAFLHGAWDPPSWLALGADIRLAALVNDVQDPEPARPIFFPMQGDLYARLALGDAWSVSLTGGLRGVARPTRTPTLAERLRGGPDLTSRLVSREHFVMWRPKTNGPYARAGRFFAPFGLRLVEHPAYVRRYMGFNVLEEPYAASGGVVKDDWELHVTGFVPNFVNAVGSQGYGGAAYLERRPGDATAVAGQAMVSVTDADTRMTAGVVGKHYFEDAKLLLMAEVDGVWQRFPDADGASRVQLVTYLGATFFPTKGLLAAAILEHYDEDVAIADVDRDAASVQINFFPRAHFELVLLGRVQTIGLGNGGPTSLLGMFQLHYYL